MRAPGGGRRRAREAAAENARALQPDDTRERVPPADGHPDVLVGGGHVQQDRRRLLHAAGHDVEGLPAAAAASAPGCRGGREVPGTPSRIPVQAAARSEALPAEPVICMQIF